MEMQDKNRESMGPGSVLYRSSHFENIEIQMDSLGVPFPFGTQNASSSPATREHVMRSMLNNISGRILSSHSTPLTTRLCHEIARPKWNPSRTRGVEKWRCFFFVPFLRGRKDSKFETVHVRLQPIDTIFRWICHPPPVPLLNVTLAPPTLSLATLSPSLNPVIAVSWRVIGAIVQPETTPLSR